MKIVIGERELELKWGFRPLMMFERLGDGESFQAEAGGLTQLLMYFWCFAFHARDHRGEDLSYDEFMDWVDDNPDKLEEFSAWLAEQTSRLPKKD